MTGLRRPRAKTEVLLCRKVPGRPDVRRDVGVDRDSRYFVRKQHVLLRVIPFELVAVNAILHNVEILIPRVLLHHVQLFHDVNRGDVRRLGDRDDALETTILKTEPQRRQLVRLRGLCPSFALPGNCRVALSAASHLPKPSFSQRAVMLSIAFSASSRLADLPSPTYFTTSGSANMARKIVQIIALHQAQL